jgi:hypothetical protein
MNPFRYSAPVGGEDLIDREGEAAALLEGAAEGNNSRIVAPRRYGKTSLLRRVLADADRSGWLGVYVDFFGVVSLGDVGERIERAYTQSLTGRAARWWEGLRRTLRPSVRFGVPGVAGASIGADVAEQAATSLLERLALPKAVSERTGERVLVVFDEFQAVLTADDRVDAIIRSEIQHHADAASYIFAGSHVGMMQQLFADRGRAFYAQARPVLLPPLPPEPTADYLARRFDATGRQIGAALGPLLDAAAGHPQRTMLLAHHVWECTAAGAVADEATFIEGQAMAMAELGEEFVVAWSGLSASERKLIVALASGQSPYAKAGNSSRGGAVQHTLNRLSASGEIVRDPQAGNGWRVVDPMLATWLRDGRRHR